MSLDDSPASVTAPVAGGRVALPMLMTQARRQLDVCNACRYCEGLCAVFPALERRRVIEDGDISQLANLCHDCRACFDACMYDPPHEFAIDLPKALSAVRVADYERYVWPRRVPGLLSGWSGLLAGPVVMLAVAVGYSGWGSLVHRSHGAASPYDVIPYGALVGLMLAACLYSVVVMAFAARSYWREVASTSATGQPAAGTRPAGGRARFTVSAVRRAAWYAATLRYLRGGGAECYYPQDDRPSAGRRRLHALVAYGFGLCVVSTAAAAITQDLVGVQPPYPVLSVPVLTGTVGGIGLVIGCAGLLVLKTRSSAVTSFDQMTIKDYGLLVSLEFLALSGLATLLVRDTAAFPIVFLIHMAAVIEALAMAPYSKFVHLVFRFAALVRDNLEREAATTAKRPVAAG